MARAIVPLVVNQWGTHRGWMQKIEPANDRLWLPVLIQRTALSFTLKKRFPEDIASPPLAIIQPPCVLRCRVSRRLRHAAYFDPISDCLHMCIHVELMRTD